ncbi:MAG: hypothetical protein ACFCUG_12325 [Thiotrichales bacterium]
MNSRAFCVARGLALALLTLGLSAVQAQVEIRESQGVSYLAGGVGIEEREAVQKLEHFFNLKLTFAQRDGHFIGDVKVRITTPQGDPVTEIDANGPLLYVVLPVGSYRVEASFGAQPQQREVSLKAAPAKTTVTFFW